MSIPEIADALERAPRQGADVEQPEALNTMARALRLASADRPDAETFEGRQP